MRPTIALLPMVFALVGMASREARAQTTEETTTTVRRPPHSNKPVQNSVFLELGGAGIVWSLNYERRAIQYFGFRFGVGVTTQDLSFYTGESGSLAEQFRVNVPITLNFLGLRWHEHTFEIGAGMALRYESLKNVSYKLDGKASESESTLDMYGIGHVGYRYHPLSNGFHFRIGLATVIGNRLNYLGRDLRAIGALPLPYIGVGASF